MFMLPKGLAVTLNLLVVVVSAVFGVLFVVHDWPLVAEGPKDIHVVVALVFGFVMLALAVTMGILAIVLPRIFRKRTNRWTE